MKSSISDKAHFFQRLKLKNRQKKISTKTGGGVRAFMSKLSGAFLLPISVLAIAGLLLGIGATIAGNANGNTSVETFGNFIKILGDPLFGALPLLFAAALAVSFTEEAGVAVFNAIIGYLIFSAIQSVFIEDIIVKETIIGVDGNPLVDANGNQIIVENLIGYKVLFGGTARDAESMKYMVGSSLGLKSLQTSVFGGIIVGLIVQWAYNKFHTIQLPQVISFFGGKRFVALTVITFMVPLAFIFLLIWPYIGFAFNWIGENSGKIGYGFDSFIFGFIERSLVPFGLHHVFYSPLWYTPAGGNVAESINNWVKAGNTMDPQALVEFAKALKGTVKDGTIIGASIFGDSTTTLALIGMPLNNIEYTLANGTKGSLPVYKFIQEQLNLKLGRFLDGKFSFMLFGLPAAGFAMYMAAPKENRKATLGVIVPASVTSFVTGVTEPIEFTFLFLAPALFFGFHAFMCATSFLLANIMNVHVGMAFSGGFLDLMVYGAIPILKGTNFWWPLIVGLGYAPIYFFVFYFVIIKLNLATPGRGGNTKLFTKKDYIASKEGTSNVENNSEVDQKSLDIIEAFGGLNNIVRTGNCASRLRFDVVDASLVSEAKLKQCGAFGVRVVSPTHVQAIFGPQADPLRVKIDVAIHSLKANK